MATLVDFAAACMVVLVGIHTVVAVDSHFVAVMMAAPPECKPLVMTATGARFD